jgi:hypothetical protein
MTKASLAMALIHAISLGVRATAAETVPSTRENALHLVQAHMENGTPGNKATTEGWMARLLEILPDADGPIDAVSAGRATPRILTGLRTVANIVPGPHPAGPDWLGDPQTVQTFDGLYSGTDPISNAYREAKAMYDTATADMGEPT